MSRRSMFAGHYVVSFVYRQTKRCTTLNEKNNLPIFTDKNDKRFFKSLYLIYRKSSYKVTEKTRDFAFKNFENMK